MLNSYYSGALAALLVSISLTGTPLWAQEASDAATSEEVTAAAAAGDDVAPEEDPLLTPEDMDTLLAPIALFPDALVSQILFAATYPLDVMKAGRFVSENPDIPEAERPDAVSANDWDPSVQALAVGFPDLVTRMSDNIDWTEQVGDAVLVQTDDVMDSVQRLRDQAAETGYQTTNDAQTVVVEGDTIVIEPTDPNVVYVPAYDPQVVYTTTAPADVVYVDNGNGNDFGDAIVTGAVVFGTAMILDEIFDNNDPWDNYWRSPGNVHWNNNDFNPGPNVKINGDVNIGSNNNRVNKINRKDVDIRKRSDVDIRRKRDNVDRNRPGAGKDRVGDLDRNAIDRKRDANFKPNDAKRAEARDKMSKRKKTGAKPAKLPATKAKAKRPANLKKPKVNKPVASSNRAKSKKPATAAKRSSKVSKPKAESKPKARKSPKKSSALKQSGGSRAKSASKRGKSSKAKRRKKR